MPFFFKKLIYRYLLFIIIATPIPHLCKHNSYPTVTSFFQSGVYMRSNHPSPSRRLSQPPRTPQPSQYCTKSTIPVPAPPLHPLQPDSPGRIHPQHPSSSSILSRPGRSAEAVTPPHRHSAAIAFVWPEEAQALHEVIISALARALFTPSLESHRPTDSPCSWLAPCTD